MEQNQQSTAEQYSEQIEQLMELGRTQGYLTYAEINDLLPEDVIDPEYYDKLLQTLQHDAGIPVLDEAPESDEMMLNDTIPDEEAVEISNTCTVFAESEVISKLSSNAKLEDLVAGIHKSVAKRVASLAFRNGIEEQVAMSGGVALNTGIVKALAEEIKTDIFVHEDCQFFGAIGAALFALEELEK